MDPERDTVAAVATPPGRGGIGIVRITGPRSREVLRAVVPSLPDPIPERRVFTAWARDVRTGERLDRVIAFVFDPSSSYTAEEAAEIQGHGGPLVLDRILSAALAAGAVPAPPGEFTRRAFLGGRMDLVQAEAVAELVAAGADRAASASVLQLAGGLSRELDAARAPLVEALSLLEASLDFADEAIPDADPTAILRLVEGSRSRLGRLLATWEGSRRIFQGVRVALAGPPNTGKSSLFNRLLGRDRAIVDAEPGTTRDFIEARASILGIRLTLVDTAGIRPGGGRIETLGMELALDAVRSADVVLLVVDASGVRPEPLRALVDAAPGVRMVAAVNKIDLPDRIDAASLSLLSSLRTFEVSALTGAGVADLARHLALGEGALADLEGPMLSCTRHRDLVSQALSDLDRARDAISRSLPAEIVSAEIREAISRLDCLTGREAVPEVLDAIFSHFCVGK